jgi:hypothetical protein
VSAAFSFLLPLMVRSVQELPYPGDPNLTLGDGVLESFGFFTCEFGPRNALAARMEWGWLGMRWNLVELYTLDEVWCEWTGQNMANSIHVRCHGFDMLLANLTVDFSRPCPPLAGLGDALITAT